VDTPNPSPLPQILLSQLQADEGVEIKKLMDQHTKDTVHKLYEAVHKVTQLFAPEGRLRQLLEIKSSGRYPST
jgi:hypothetical protein